MTSWRNYFHGPAENWIVDRFKQEWDSCQQNNPVLLKTTQGTWTHGATTKFQCSVNWSQLDSRDLEKWMMENIDVCWINADWCWRDIPLSILQAKKNLITIHHIVPEKFGRKERSEFYERDNFVTAYHVYNEHVLDFVSSLTTKSIHFIPYWFDQTRFQPSTLTKNELRLKYGLPLDSFIVGSAQRDTEGNSILSGTFLPKLEKGADLFCDAIQRLKETTHPNIHVLLGGWRRQYVIKRLNEMNCPFSYFELPKQEKLNELLQSIDLYIVASRCEGGPQAILECSSLRIPVVSRPVGIASQCLPSSAINEDVTKAEPAIPVIQESMKLPRGFQPYRDLISSL